MSRGCQGSLHPLVGRKAHPTRWHVWTLEYLSVKNRRGSRCAPAHCSAQSARRVFHFPQSWVSGRRRQTVSRWPEQWRQQEIVAQSWVGLPFTWHFLETRLEERTASAAVAGVKERFIVCWKRKKWPALDNCFELVTQKKQEKREWQVYPMTAAIRGYCEKSSKSGTNQLMQVCIIECDQDETKNWTGLALT